MRVSGIATFLPPGEADDHVLLNTHLAPVQILVHMQIFLASEAA